MYRSFFALILFLFLFACQSTQPSIDETPVSENAIPVCYPPSDVQKMRWLAGIWKGEEAGHPVRRAFQFHGRNVLEILFLDKDGKMSTCFFVWHEGRYYFGQYRQWAVTWIGEKEVRFDPIRSGLAPMTWTRLNDNGWNLVRHSPKGDETTLMERTNEMHP